MSPRKISEEDRKLHASFMAAVIKGAGRTITPLRVAEEAWLYLQAHLTFINEKEAEGNGYQGDVGA